MSQPPSDHRDEAHHEGTISKVVKNEKEIEKKLAGQKALKALLENGRLLMQMVIDYARGNYREVPYWAIGAAGLALLYVFSPVDAIPDIIPVLGYLDDASVLAFCLKLVDTELGKYKEWREAREADEVPPPVPVG